MGELKTLGYDWELGHEELIVRTGAYLYGDHLYVSLHHMVDGELDDFSDLTVNLPFGDLNDINEAYIDEFASKAKLAFIRKHKLGKILPEFGYSGFCKYAKVAFDLKRLAELDPEGMEKYMAIHGQPGNKEISAMGMGE